MSFSSSFPTNRTVPGLGQESVWDYPERPNAVSSGKHIQVIFNGVTVAETHRSVRVLQRGVPPVFYLPPDAVRTELLVLGEHSSICSSKGQAEYFHLRVAERIARNAAWRYLESPADVTPADYFGFYVHLVDACLVDGERAAAPEWTWLGGWITPGIVGPFLRQKEAEQLWNL